MKVGAITETNVDEYRLGLTHQGVRAPMLVSREMLRSMGTGAVVVDALREDDALAAGANTIRGTLVSEPVASAQGLSYVSPEQAI